MGGYDGDHNFLNKANVYDLVTGQWTVLPGKKEQLLTLENIYWGL